MSVNAFYPIGVPGQPWGEAEKRQWLSRQVRRRSYEEEVVRAVEALHGRFDVERYGQLDYPPDAYALYAVRSRPWGPRLPIAIVTGGVHGYETSGVQGALLFLHEHAQAYAGRVNLLVVPCVSPWGYERIHRWNPEAIDPNRSFRADSPAPESAALWRLLAPLREQALLHIDLHETTDSDESEFRPALAARDGKPFEADGIPDGFYLVGDSENPQPEFQQAVIAAVERVTHIAPPDEQGRIIGTPLSGRGVIDYPVKRLGLCTGITQARYTTTTEVYPDSPSATPAECNAAQVAAIRAALDYALDHH